MIVWDIISGKLIRDKAHSCRMALCSHDWEFPYCRKLFVILSLKNVWSI